MQRTAEESGWPHAIPSPMRISAPTTCALSSTGSSTTRWCEGCACNCTGTNPLYRFAARADLCADPTFRRNVARLADYGWSFDLQVFAPQMPQAAGLAEACRTSRSCYSTPGCWRICPLPFRSAWRAGMVRLAACPNVVCKLSGLGTFIHRNDPAHIAATLADSVAIFGSDRCLFGSNFPIEKLWTSYRDLVDAYLDAVTRAARASGCPSLREARPSWVGPAAQRAAAGLVICQGKIDTLL